MSFFTCDPKAILTSLTSEVKAFNGKLPEESELKDMKVNDLVTLWNKNTKNTTFKIPVKEQDSSVPICKFHIGEEGDEKYKDCKKNCKKHKKDEDHPEGYEIVCAGHFKYQYDSQTGEAVVCGCDKGRAIRAGENHTQCVRCEKSEGKPKKKKTNGKKKKTNGKAKKKNDDE
jgi:hypothetical protein